MVAGLRAPLPVFAQQNINHKTEAIILSFTGQSYCFSDKHYSTETRFSSAGLSNRGLINNIRLVIISTHVIYTRVRARAHSHPRVD